MKHLLLDVNVVVDLSVQRSGTANAEIALSLAEYAGISIWVYAGSVQTLEYVTASELRVLLANTGITLSRTESQRRAKELLGQFPEKIIPNRAGSPPFEKGELGGGF